jgi:hypothetical protein
MATNWTQVKIKLPKTIKPKERVALAEVLLTHIVTRTLNGEDKNNKKFKNYTEKYADIKGVDVSDVDLTLDGEMLEALELVSHKSGEITIGYKDPSDELAGKVEGNRSGLYGNSTKKKARDFLGITQDDLNLIIDAYQEDDEPVSDEELTVFAKELAQEALDDL